MNVCLTRMVILSRNMTIKAISIEHILNVADVFSASDKLVPKHPYPESPLHDFRATAISRVACEDDLALKELLKQCAAELLVDQMRKALEEHADNFDAHMDKQGLAEMDKQLTDNL